jgi:hypothetical protein
MRLRLFLAVAAVQTKRLADTLQGLGRVLGWELVDIFRADRIDHRLQSHGMQPLVGASRIETV